MTSPSSIQPRRPTVRWSAALAYTAVMIMVVWLVGCATNRFDKPREGKVQRGVASWYGEPFHGRATASGEIYDMHGLTAAHRDLPLGSIVDVTNVANKKKVRVKVNDRGPFIRGRVLDLSYGAAKKLSVVGPGTAKVEIRIVRLGKGPPGPGMSTKVVVQTGAFRELRNARELQRKLERDLADPSVAVSIETRGGIHRVVVGPFRKYDEAEETERWLERRGYSALVIARN